MSNPGLTTAQLTPELLQQAQAQNDQQKKMAMAQALMSNKATGQYSGLTNAGNDILGAVTANNLQQGQQQAMQNQMAANTPAAAMQTGYGQVSANLPQLPSQSGMMSKLGGLFNLGSGS